MIVRKATDADLSSVLSVESQAFGHDKEAELVRGLLSDPTAQPLLSLIALDDEKALGHVLFTQIKLTNDNDSVSASILAPLAVIPEAQKQGVGGKLVQEGLRLLTESGVDLVFVLGHPDYYPRHGFIAPAGALGFEAPYHIPEKHAHAWMVQELRPGIIGSVKGKVVCSDVLNQPQHWRE